MLASCKPKLGIPAVADRRRTERVLVVEDDAELNALICELLTSAGYRASGVFDGEKAVERVCAEEADAVILDVMLPTMDGFEVCRRLKSHRRTNGVPTLMLTALEKEGSRRQGLRVGANRYLTKPFDPEVLLQELREVLDHRREMVERKTHAVVEFQMQSDSRMFEQLNDLLSELFVLTPLPDAEIDLVRQAILEMIENAREWGNRGHPDLVVAVSYEVTDDALKIIITDQGAGFDPTDCPHAACDEDPAAHMDVREALGLRFGGFGIMLAKGIMTELKYNERGNQVTLVKKLRDPIRLEIPTPQSSGGEPSGEDQNDAD